jgi:phosphotriesterase-related protein
MMKKVNTVLGPISPEQVGIANMHEHIIWAKSGWEYAPEANELYNPPEVFQTLYDTLADYKKAGGNTIVDCSGVCMGRDVELYATLSRASGVNIVACTGFWAQENVVPYFLSAKTGGGHAFKDIDYFEEMFTRELTQGMGTSQVKAGVIKVGNGKEGIRPFEERTYRAAARASRATGAAIITHGINFAPQQVEIFLEEKVDPERVVISHCDAAYNLNFERDKEIAQKGFYLGYDHIGYEPEWSPMPYAMSDTKRIELCKALIDAGYAKNLIISCDAEPCRVGWDDRGAEKNSQGYAHLLRNFVPRLKEAGVPEKTIHLLLVETPQKLLPF